jgi:site-specific recombinase XerC
MTEGIYAIRTIKELLGHNVMKTTMTYTHAPSREVISIQMLQIFFFLRQAQRPRSARKTVATLRTLCGSAHHD